MSDACPGWRECADPVELAAAVAAGVEVEYSCNGRWYRNSFESEGQFRGSIANLAYRVPASWSWSPEPPAPDDLMSRARGHAETHPESRELIEELLEELLEAVVRWACFAAPSPVPSWPDGVLRDAANRLRWIANSGYIEDPGIKRIIRSWADELDATLVPPWPGAVPSGLTDEDGVPTWLAQAGQVRGEQVRFGPHGAWWPNTVDDFDPDNDFVEDRWVEVRAPRAVPVPETERVQAWEAVGRRWPDGRTVWKVTHSVEGVIAWDNGGEALDVMFSADGTVEVLKDGDR
ncbi:MAG: hypothetical protein IPG97_19560 [Microthrixaceae bacterium]|nr:hypothetical protein [Microthrixaceae bacterium]